MAKLLLRACNIQSCRKVWQVSVRSFLRKSKPGHNKVPSVKASANNCFQTVADFFLLFFTWSGCTNTTRVLVTAFGPTQPRAFFVTFPWENRRTFAQARR